MSRSGIPRICGGTTIQADEIPGLIDEVPILALTATQAKGETVFEEVGELRLKESDRLEAIATQLTLMGARVSTPENRLVVSGPTPLTEAPELDSFGDHRIAMTLRMAGLLTGTNPSISQEESIGISYPGFHDDLARLKTDDQS